MWSRVRHRRLQALALLALAALLTTCLCLGPLYQRAMEQGLAGSVLATATAEQTSLLLDSKDRSEQQLEDLFPHQLDPYFAAPVVSRNALVSVQPPVGVTPVATRLYAVDGACHHLEVVSGRCPTRPGEVMVSSADVRTNGWTLGSRVQFSERLDASQTAEPGSGTLSLVGVYKPPSPETDWLSAPLTGRAGTVIADVGPATDDWVTSPETITSSGAPTTWHQITSTVVWSLNPATVDHDTLVRIGPVVDRILQQTLQGSSIEVLASTDLPALSKRVASGGEQGRTTVVVLISQLLVLVAVVLWMVLVAATEDRRRELALARLRGRGRRGAVGYLLSELLPLTLAGVAAGVLASPFVMALVARVIFPVPVPLELSGSFLLAALAAVAAVVAVVLAAAGRAVREPVDSLLRAVPSRHLGVGASAAEISLIVFSLSAVTVLLTGRLEGPLATLAPTLLAVAAGLLLGRSLAPATRYLSRRLLRRGRAVAAAGIITAVRRPAARRVLAMVVVATALLVFCVDAMVTGQHNRANAAEQLNGAAYSLDVDPSSRLTDVVAALEAADPEHQHLTPVVTTTNNGLSTAPTLAVDPTAFPRVAYFPLSRPDPADWDAIRAPSVAPVELTGDSLAGTVASTGVRLAGPSKKLVDDLMISVEVLDTQGLYETVQLSVIPTGDASVQFAAAMPCAEGCTVTGVAVRGPVGGRISGTVVLRGLSVDGQPFSLGPTTSWRRATDSGATVIPAADPAGGLGLVVSSDIASPPVMLSAWVPGPVPALVSGDETGVFSAQGTGGQVDLKAVATVARVPGAPPGARVVDLQGMLRRPERPDGNVAIEVWADDAQALARARTELEKRGATPRRTTTVDDVRAQLDASPAVWSLELSVLVGAAAVLVAMLVMVVATATTWRARATDLAALRMAGLADRSLRRLELLGQVPVVVAGAVAGTACGLVAAVLTLPGLRQFTDPPAVDTTDFSTRWPAVLVGALLAAVVLTVVAVAASRWTARRASLGRVREVV